MFLHKTIAYTIATLHLIVILLNLLSVPLLIVNTPFYIWMPIITFLVSPLVGGTYCLFNRIENHYRFLAGMDPIHDRLWSTIEFISEKIKKTRHITTIG